MRDELEENGWLDVCIVPLYVAEPRPIGLREALAPFAKAADAWDHPADTWVDSAPLDPEDRRNKLLTGGDLRRARSVHAGRDERDDRASC
jgi:hypothetical protein